MISLEQLASLDLYFWLGRGQEVARRLGVNQSTVSRQIQTTLQLLDLRLARGQGPGGLRGDQELLRAERTTHQLARLRGMAPLRIDGTYCSGPWFLTPPPTGWMVGRFDLPGMQRPLELLEQRLIDAWVGSYQPDLPDADDPHWWVLDLVREPVRLLAAPDHPLAGERRIQRGDLQRFPSLALPDGWFPRTEAVLREQGLWCDPVSISRYDPASWEGRCADGVTLTYGQSLSEALQPSTVRLDWNLGLVSGEALVVRRDLMNRPAIQQLAAELQRRAASIAARFNDVAMAG